MDGLMATFIWDAAVQWPPPANILLNYDVVVNGDVIPALGSTRGVSKMAAAEVTISGVLYDKLSRSTRPVTIIGEATITGLGVGGGPIYPPDGGGGQPGDPPGIWGGGNVPMPTPPIANVPGAPGYRPPGDHIWGPTDPRPTPPIYIPPAVPPSMKPPEAPEPGAPTTAVPGDWPVQPITPPEYLIVQYPGVGPVVVAPPAAAQPKA
jgi:hypothetical protein